MDIITHVTVCASGDLAKIDKIVIGNFVTASQAQRKWYTKVISEVSSGDHRLGAVRFPLSLFKFWSDFSLFNLFVEFSEYHRAESYDWPAGGREDAGLCGTWYQTFVSGTDFFPSFIDHLLILPAGC